MNTNSISDNWGDTGVRQLLSEEAYVRRLVEVEIALAGAEAGKTWTSHP